MVALPVLRRRIRSVSNTRQITKAMQLVAASKLRQAEEIVRQPAIYTEALAQVVANLGSWPESALHPYYRARPVKRTLLIIVTSDRGLAGAYNANILRSAAVETGKGDSVAICIGKKAESAVARASDLDELAAYDLETPDADIALAKPIAREAATGYLDGDFDRVVLISTRFQSTTKQTVEVRQLLPVQPAEAPTLTHSEPQPESVINCAVIRYLEAEVYNGVLEGIASEQAARMLAMMNATDNAGELIDDLTLLYNQERQSAITQELAEISGGVEAMQGGQS